MAYSFIFVLIHCKEKENSVLRNKAVSYSSRIDTADNSNRDNKSGG